jgi:hypothetical protein
MRLEPMRTLAAVTVAILLTGCALAAQNIVTQPPGRVHNVGAVDFEALKASEAVGQVGAAYIGMVVTMRAGNQRILAGQHFRIYPYSPYFHHDMLTLLDWWLHRDYSPEGIARGRDSGRYIDSLLWTYGNKMAEFKVAHLHQQGQSGMDGSAVIGNLPAGEYLVTSQWNGYQGRFLVWAVKFRISPRVITQVMLTNDNALFGREL